MSMRMMLSMMAWLYGWGITSSLLLVATIQKLTPTQAGIGFVALIVGGIGVIGVCQEHGKGVVR